MVKTLSPLNPGLVLADNSLLERLWLWANDIVAIQRRLTIGLQDFC